MFSQIGEPPWIRWRSFPAFRVCRKAGSGNAGFSDIKAAKAGPRCQVRTDAANQCEPWVQAAPWCSQFAEVFAWGVRTLHPANLLGLRRLTAANCEHLSYRIAGGASRRAMPTMQKCPGGTHKGGRRRLGAGAGAGAGAGSALHLRNHQSAIALCQ